MLLDEHEGYHKIGPKDVGLQTHAKIDVVRTTSVTHEQFHIEIPVYPDDSREMLRNRVGMFLSVIQDRLEEENKAVNALNKKQQTLRIAQESIKRNNKLFTDKKRKLDKQLRQKNIGDDEYKAKLKELQDELAKANETFSKSLEDEGLAAQTAEEADQEAPQEE